MNPLIAATFSVFVLFLFFSDAAFAAFCIGIGLFSIGLLINAAYRWFLQAKGPSDFDD